MKKSNQRPPNRAVLRVTGESDEPKGPTRGVRLPESLDRLVEGRTTPTLPRAAIIIDLVRKGLRYERLREAKGDPALGELLKMMDEMLAARLAEATTQLYRRVSFDCLLLKRLLEEVHGDARISSSAAERLLTGRVLTPPHVLTGRELEEFLSECQEGAASVVAEIQEEWQKEGDLKLGRHPVPDAGPSPEHQPSPSTG